MSIILHTIRRSIRIQPALCRFNCTDVEQTKDNEKSKLGGFAQAFEKYTADKTEEPVEEKQTFASLLRHSKFIDVSL